VLARVDPDALDQVIGRWLTQQQPPSPTTRPPPPTRVAWRQAVAVDGKTLPGSGHWQVHLLAAMDHTSRRILGQTDVDHTTNEIARFQPLLQPLDLAERVVTADALHTQREHADWLVTHCPRTPSHVGWRTASRVGRRRASVRFACREAILRSVGTNLPSRRMAAHDPLAGAVDEPPCVQDPGRGRGQLGGDRPGDRL
jgi:predicted transposase YbfD/YdcC